MNRRSFLKKACVGAAIAAAAGTVGLSAILPETKAPVVIDAVIGSYENYCSFSALAIATAVDECVKNSAAELSFQAGKSVQFLYNSVN